MRAVILSLALLSAPLTMGAGLPSDPVRSDDAGARGPGQCFTADQVKNLQVRSGRIYVLARASDVFEASSEGCDDRSFDQSLSLTAFPTAVSDRICVGDEAQVRTLGPITPPRTCNIKIDRKLAAGEASPF